MELKNCGIYKITNPRGRVYIGQSIDCEKRIFNYLKYNKVGTQKRLKNSFNKYGRENHMFEIIELCDKNSLNERERYWQEFYKVLTTEGLNCKYVNTNDKSGQLSTIIKNKISNTLKGKKRPEEFRNKMSLLKKDKKLSKEHIEAIKKGQHNNPKSKEWRVKQGKINAKEVFCFNINKQFINSYYSAREAGRVLNVSFENITQAIKYKRLYNNCFWSYCKEETLEKHSMCRKDSLNVHQYTLDKEYINKYNSISQAAKALNISKSGIIRCCKNRQKQAGGFIWTYEEAESSCIDKLIELIKNK
jgi:group I intron endonuclease